MNHIPVYRSRYTPLDNMPDKYGAYIDWKIGERVAIRTTSDPRSKPTFGTIRSETQISESAPLIPGARGENRWVREVLCEDDGQLWNEHGEFTCYYEDDSVRDLLLEEDLRRSPQDHALLTAVSRTNVQRLLR